MLQDLDPLEIHSGAVFGRRRSPGPGGLPEGVASPREVLEEILLDALAKPPCTVLFSGGRDSSVILAAAVDVARRHGLPQPLALTGRYAAHPATHEYEWQEMVVNHLSVKGWEHVDPTPQLDTLGEMASDTIRRFGVYWPSNSHNMRYFARQAGGGTLLTGGGGDELFTPWYLRRLPIRTLARRRPLKRAAFWVAVHQLPPPLRRRVIAKRHRTRLITPWLRPDAEVDLQRQFEASQAQSWSIREAYEDLAESRYIELVRLALDAFAELEGVRLIEPLYDPRMVSAVVEAAPRDGYRSRGKALEMLFSDLLPREVLYRSTKAQFTEVAWGPNAREFAASWDGTGIDERLVDHDALRAEWAKPRPHARAVPCLHQAWYASQAAH